MTFFSLCESWISVWAAGELTAHIRKVPRSLCVCVCVSELASGKRFRWGVIFRQRREFGKHPEMSCSQHKHTHTQTDTHTHTQAHAQTQKLTYTHTYTHSCTNSEIHAPPYTHTHTHTHTYTLHTTVKLCVCLWMCVVLKSAYEVKTFYECYISVCKSEWVPMVKCGMCVSVTVCVCMCVFSVREYV